MRQAWALAAWSVGRSSPIASVRTRCSARPRGPPDGVGHEQAPELVGLQVRVVVEVGERFGDQPREVVHGLNTAGARPRVD